MRSKEYVINLINCGRHFCIMPWIHLYVNGWGNMGACSREAKEPYSRGYGNLNKYSFQELWQGESIRKFRIRLLNDEADPRCVICHEQEKAGFWNSRQWYNHLYAERYLDWVVNTDEAGFARDAKPVYWDIRFSNLCNLRCRSCSYYASSGWFEDTKKLGAWDTKTARPVITGVTNSVGLLHDLEQYFPCLEKVMFAGGEPLLIHENYHILERLDFLKKYDIELFYITNMTKLHFPNYELLPIWKKFNRLYITVSLDGIGARCEYLRKGLQWQPVLENLTEVKRACPNADIRINYTVSAFNVIHLADFHREMVENHHIAANQILLNFLNETKYYSVKILPPELKKRASVKLEDHILWLKQQAPFNDPQSFKSYEDSFLQWRNGIEFMNNEDWTHLIPKFIGYTNKLDAMRNEKCLEVFPELKSIFA